MELTKLGFQQKFLIRFINCNRQNFSSSNATSSLGDLTFYLYEFVGFTSLWAKFKTGLYIKEIETWYTHVK